MYKETVEECGEDGKWIAQLSEILRDHWKTESDFQLELDHTRKQNCKTRSAFLLKQRRNRLQKRKKGTAPINNFST